MPKMGAHVQARFFTKQSKYSVPDTPFSVPVSVGTKELSSLINSLLNESFAASQPLVEFDFLISGEFLRLPLEKHLEQKELSTEAVVEIEYVERHPAPKPEDSLVHDDWVSCLHSSGQHILSGCYDNTVRLWTANGDSVMTIPGHSAPVKTVAWIKLDDDPVSCFVSGSHDQTLLLWQWNRDKNEVDCVCACRGHAGSVDCVSVDDTCQRICSGSWDSMLKIWSARTNDDGQFEDIGERPQKKKKSEQKINSRVPLLTLSGHSEGISTVFWLDMNEVCTASWDHTIKIWDLEQASVKSTLQGTKVFLDVAYSPLNRMLVTGSADRHIRLWDARTKDGTIVKCTFTSHTGWVSGVSWSPTSEYQFLSGSYDMLLKLWDTRSPKAPLYNMSGHEDKILAVDWSVPHLLLSGGADNHLKIFHHQDPATTAIS